MKGKLRCLGEKRGDGVGKQGRWRERKGEFKALKKDIKALNLVSIELKRFLNTDFNTKNYFRALDHRLGHIFYHLIKIKTHLSTTVIGRIRHKQVENLKYYTEEFITQLLSLISQH